MRSPRPFLVRATHAPGSPRRVDRARDALRTLAIVLAAAAAMPAQGVGLALIRLRELEVSGLAAFSRDDVATALLRDATTLAALQRPLDAEAAAVVAERVRELHRRAGYARAEASAKLVGQAVHVALDAGPRFRCGDVRCSGNELVDTATLTRRVTSRPPVAAFGTETEKLEARAAAARAWVAGEFATMDDRATERVQRLVTEAYRERGRYGARAAVEFVPDGERMTLRIVVADEGREVRVRSVKLDGEDATAADAVMSSTGVAPDTLATTAALGSLRSALEATARYTQVDVTVADDAPVALEPLVVKVVLRPDAPALNPASLRDVEQVGRALRGLAARLERGDTMRLEGALAQTSPWGDHVRLLPGHVTLRVGRDGVLFETERLQFGDAAPARIVFGLTGLGMLFAHGERRIGWRFGGSSPLQLQVVSRMTPTGDMEFRWGAGVSARGAALLDVTLHPATARQVLVRASSVQRDGDVLALRFGESTVRIGADGALLDPELKCVVDGQQLTLSWHADGLGDVTRELSGGGTAQDFAGSVAGMLADRITGLDAPSQALVHGAATAAAASLAAELASAFAESPAGALPSLGDSPARSMLAGIGLFLATPAVARARTGRFVSLCTPFACALLGDGRTSKALFEALAEDEQAGPLTLSTVATAWALLGKDATAATFRDLAAQRWSFERCWDDAAALTAGFPSLQPLPARIGAQWRTQPELTELLADLPAGVTGDLAAWRKGVEHLWNAGGGELLRDALLSK